MTFKRVCWNVFVCKMYLKCSKEEEKKPTNLWCVLCSITICWVHATWWNWTSVHVFMCIEMSRVFRMNITNYTSDKGAVDLNVWQIASCILLTWFKWRLCIFIESSFEYKTKNKKKDLWFVIRFNMHIIKYILRIHLY